MLRHFQICWLLLLNTLLNQVPVTLLYGIQHMPRLKQGYHYLCSHTRSYTYNHFDFNDPNNVLAGGRCVTESKCIMFVMLLSFSSFSVTTIYIYIYMLFAFFCWEFTKKCYMLLLLLQQDAKAPVPLAHVCKMDDDL